MRTWVSRVKDENPQRCFVWVELGRCDFLWILQDGRHGVATDMSGILIRDLVCDVDKWEQVT